MSISRLVLGRFSRETTRGDSNNHQDEGKRSEQHRLEMRDRTGGIEHTPSAVQARRLYARIIRVDDGYNPEVFRPGLLDGGLKSLLVPLVINLDGRQDAAGIVRALMPMLMGYAIPGGTAPLAFRVSQAGQADPGHPKKRPDNQHYSGDSDHCCKYRYRGK